MSKPSEKPVRHEFDGIEVWTQYWYNLDRGDEKQMTLQIGQCFCQCRFVNGKWTLPRMGNEVTEEFKEVAQKFLGSFHEPVYATCKNSVGIEKEHCFHVVASLNVQSTWSEGCTQKTGEKQWIDVDLGSLTSLPVKAMQARAVFEGSVPDELDLSAVEYFPGYEEMQQVQQSFDEIRVSDSRERAIAVTQPYYDQWDALTVQARAEIAKNWPELRDQIRALLVGKAESIHN